MSKYIKIFLVLISVGVVTLPVWAGEVNVNNTKANSSLPAKLFKIRPIFFNKAMLKTIDGQTLSVAVNGQTYTVNVTDKTKLLRKYGAKSNLSEFAPGHSLQIYGKRLAESVVQASLIRNSSIEKKRATFLGVVESIGSASQTFVLQPVGRTKVTVTVLADTKIVYKSRLQTFADLAVGSKLAVSGVWDKNNNTITEVTKIVVMSVPKAVKK